MELSAHEQGQRRYAAKQRKKLTAALRLVPAKVPVLSSDPRAVSMRSWRALGGKQTRKPEYRQHARSYQRELRRDRKRKLVELKGGKCVDCGYAGHITALQFDHRDASTKVSEVTTLIRISWERALAEVEKCDLVCANCHAIRTFTRRLV